MSEPEIATREEILALRTQKARVGSTSATIALERALRIGTEEADEESSSEDLFRELDR
jgi:hypothetical protein